MKYFFDRGDYVRVYLEFVSCLAAWDLEANFAANLLRQLDDTWAEGDASKRGQLSSILLRCHKAGDLAFCFFLHKGTGPKICVELLQLLLKTAIRVSFSALKPHESHRTCQSHLPGVDKVADYECSTA